MVDQARNTKEEILQAALELFVEKGYHSSSMAAIAERAGVGKGTLYWHFSSKEELFKEMLTSKAENLFADLQSLVSSENLSPEEILKRMIYAKISFAVKHQELSQVMFREFQAADDEFKEKLCQKHVEMIITLQQVIDRGIATGVFREGSSRQMAIAILGITNSVNSHFLFEPVEDLSTLVESYCQMILNGIRKL